MFSQEAELEIGDLFIYLQHHCSSLKFLLGRIPVQLLYLQSYTLKLSVGATVLRKVRGYLTGRLL